MPLVTVYMVITLYNIKLNIKITQTTVRASLISL